MAIDLTAALETGALGECGDYMACAPEDTGSLA